MLMPVHKLVRMALSASHVGNSRYLSFLAAFIKFFSVLQSVD